MAKLGHLLIPALAVFVLASCQSARLKPGGEDLPEPETGFLLMETNSQTTLAHLNEDKSFVPASLTKAITATFALGVLGEDYHYKTELRMKGKDLYLEGSGDPFLTAAHLMGMAQALKRKGIHEITGHFYYDDTLFASQDEIDSEMDAAYSYNPGISALSSEFNQAMLRWNFSQEWVGPRLYVVPGLPLFSAEKGAAAAPKQLIYASQEGHETWNLSADTRLIGNTKLPVKHPGEFTALFFAELCRLEGITLPKVEAGKTPASATRVVVHVSEPLLQTVDRMLEYSNNMTAELLAMTAARKVAGHPVTVSEAAGIMKSWLSDRIKRPEFDQIDLSNSSGLTLENHVSPHQIVELLDYAEAHPIGDRRFSSLLPISGWKGTLSERLVGPDTVFRVWAKTGSLDFVSTMGGYLYSASGRKLLFAIFMKDDQLREKSESMSHAEEEDLSERWAKMAHVRQERYLHDWVTQF